MSGHSKFANIKHKKEKNDAAKGKIFTKLGRELAVAVKEGGGRSTETSRKRQEKVLETTTNTSHTRDTGQTEQRSL